MVAHWKLEFQYAEVCKLVFLCLSFFFFLLLGKMIILLVVDNFKYWVGQEAQSPHCSTIISHKTHNWVLSNETGQILNVWAMWSARPQNYNIDNSIQALALFLDFKLKNKVWFLCKIILYNTTIRHILGVMKAP